MIRALIEKDLKLFFRNPLFAVITVLVMVAFVGVYYLLPGTTEDTLGLALYVEGEARDEMIDLFSEGLEAEIFASEKGLVAAVEDGKYPAGLVLTTEALVRAAAGEETAVRVYYTPGITTDLREAYNDILTIALNYHRLGAEGTINIEAQEEVMGPDLLGEPIPARDRFMPAMLLIIAVVEMLGLSTIIVEEVEHDTVTALLTTPLQVGQFLTSKAVKGVALAFGQLFFVLLVTGLIVRAPVMLIITLLLGCLLIVGLAFIVASFTSDMMSVMSWGILVYIVLLIPAFGVLFPGVAGGWVRAIPSHYFITALHRIINFEASWADVSSSFLSLFVAGVVALVVGSLALRRRFS